MELQVSKVQLLQFKMAYKHNKKTKLFFRRLFCFNDIFRNLSIDYYQNKLKQHPPKGGFRNDNYRLKHKYFTRLGIQ